MLVILGSAHHDHAIEECDSMQDIVMGIGMGLTVLFTVMLMSMMAFNVMDYFLLQMIVRVVAGVMTWSWVTYSISTHPSTP